MKNLQVLAKTQLTIINIIFQKLIKAREVQFGVPVGPDLSIKRRMKPRVRKLKEVRELKEEDDKDLAKHLEDVDESADVFEMYSHYLRSKSSNQPSPKCDLVSWHRDFFKPPNEKISPIYRSWQKDKLFRSVAIVKLPSRTVVFSGEFWEKNKKFSQQAAAMVGLECIKNPDILGQEASESESKRPRIS